MFYPHDPEVAELAWLELALSEAFVGHDAVSLTPENLVGVDWDHAVLRFTPTLGVRTLTTNAPAIWSSITDNQEPPTVTFLPEPGALLTWRHAQTPRFRATHQSEARAIERLHSGVSFGDLCAQIVAESGEEEGSGWLAPIWGNGLLTGFWSALGLERRGWRVRIDGLFGLRTYGTLRTSSNCGYSATVSQAILS